MRTKRTPFPAELFDTTIRDGSYAVDFQFTRNDIRLLSNVLQLLGFTYIEIGHGFGLNASKVKGAAAASDEEYLQAASQALNKAKFGTFFIPGIAEKKHLHWARSEFGMNFVRIGYDADQIEKTIEYVEYAKELGYEVMSNFMKSYIISPSALARKARLLQEHGSDVVYIVDSAGGMLPEEVGEYVKAVAEECSIRIGFHGHNNLELALANCLSAYRRGCSLFDCSIGGLGRSSGNTRTELIIPSFKRMGVDLGFDLVGIIKALEAYIEPLLRRKITGPLHLIGGYSRVHSGLMEPFVRYAGQYNIDIKELLYAFGETSSTGVSDTILEEIARQLAAETKEHSYEGGTADSKITTLGGKRNDPAVILNSFVAVEDLMQAVYSLSRKIRLPVVALISLVYTPFELEFITADYLYDDEHFIVIRITTNSVSKLKEVFQRHAGTFDVLAFERLSTGLKRELMADADAWRKDEIIVYTSRPMMSFQHLFSVIYSLAIEHDAQRLLFCGGSFDYLANNFPQDMAMMDCYYAGGPVAGPLDRSLPASEIKRLDMNDEVEGKKSPFDLVILLSTLDAHDLERILDFTRDGGVLVDCVLQTSVHRSAIDMKQIHVIDVNLWKAVSSNVISILGTQFCGPLLKEDEI